MYKSHEKFFSADGKRLVLVVDDEEINRVMMGTILEKDYEVIYACDGDEAMEMIRSNQDLLSLVLLDLMMPVMPGMEVLRQMKADSALQHIPVIVLTADQNAEIESLAMGAVDFIPKPYPKPGIIMARILRTIELSEDRDIIQATERDPLTGLYNKEYFFRYAEQYDQHHKDSEMDAIVIDINHFHIINERFGTTYGDEVLRRIANRLREMVHDDDGTVCRLEADTFMIYCPHGKDFQEILENASVSMTGDESIGNRVRLRLGVYENVDKSLDMERRFDRAKMAADNARNSYTKVIGIYDNALHERELYAEQLIEDFPRAIAEHQFTVWYQPKFNVSQETPVLTSAEALVRWKHPTLGMISPGVFIPLFEDNGLIRTLDNYVWNMAAAQLKDWKERLGYSVPVSVNVSRIDMYDPELINNFRQLLDDNGLETKEFFLEITESAYTQDSEQIIDTVNRLREIGFQIEMDDFGTGYSSLNMISTLPIDALKLDMQFVRNAFRQQLDTRMLEVIIDIAGHLHVPVIAEGVETEEQMQVLKGLGCDIVQGYYFSKPVPADEFEPFLLNALDMQNAAQESTTGEQPPSGQKEGAARESVQERQDKAAAEGKKGVPMKLISHLFLVIAIVLAALLLICDTFVTRHYQQVEDASERYERAVDAADDFLEASDYLTESVRCFAVTGEPDYAADFFTEVETTRRRDEALQNLYELIDSSKSNAYGILVQALEYSNELMEREYLCIRLIQRANGYPDEVMPDAVSSIELPEEYLAMSPLEQREQAVQLVFDDAYSSIKDLISNQVNLCAQDLTGELEGVKNEAGQEMKRLLRIQTMLTIMLMLTVMSLVCYISYAIRRPLTHMVKRMRMQAAIVPSGAEELRFVSRTYNEMLEQTTRTHKQLSYEASHDALTGLYNRSAYEMFIQSVDMNHTALLLVDVDKFKEINDSYGHDIGDRMLEKVAQLLRQSFRSVDIICRIGGDEFVVIMTRVNSSMSQLVTNKIAHVNELLRSPDDGLPPASMSVGVAFADRMSEGEDLFKNADTALYRVKARHGCGCEIY